MRLKANFVLPGRIDGETRETMWRLFNRFFDDVTRPAFERDLADKHRVILLHETTRCRRRSRSEPWLGNSRSSPDA